jgi:hypothetical protein
VPAGATAGGLWDLGPGLECASMALPPGPQFRQIRGDGRRGPGARWPRSWARSDSESPVPENREQGRGRGPGRSESPISASRGPGPGSRPLPGKLGAGRGLPRRLGPGQADRDRPGGCSARALLPVTRAPLPACTGISGHLKPVHQQAPAAATSGLHCQPCRHLGHCRHTAPQCRGWRHAPPGGWPTRSVPVPFSAPSPRDSRTEGGC